MESRTKTQKFTWMTYCWRRQIIITLLSRFPYKIDSKIWIIDINATNRITNRHKLSFIGLLYFKKNLLWEIYFHGMKKCPIVSCNRNEFIQKFLETNAPQVSYCHHLPVQSQQWKYQNNVWNLFKVNNNETKQCR